jgi:hypothetical protein
VQADYAPFQGYVEMPQVMAPMVMGNMATENLRLLNEQHAKGATARPRADAISTVVPAAGTSNAPQRLAARYPSAQRPQIEHAFRESLAGYHQLEDKLGIPRNDAAGAVAAYVAGSYMAYRDVSLPDEHFKQLVEQMRTLLAGNKAFQRASNAEKREMYEQMAIIGTFMAVTRESLKRQPSQAQYAENVKQAAKANLEQFLKTDANRVEINDRGLVIR